MLRELQGPSAWLARGSSGLEGSWGGLEGKSRTGHGCGQLWKGDAAGLPGRRGGGSMALLSCQAAACSQGVQWGTVWALLLTWAQGELLSCCQRRCATCKASQPILPAIPTAPRL